jgi:hypothetical protein
MMGCHVLILLGFAPIGRPRYLNGSSHCLHIGILLALVKKHSSTFTPTRLLFRKLTKTPIQSFLGLLYENEDSAETVHPQKTISSANCNKETSISFFQTMYGVNEPGRESIFMRAFRIQTFSNNKEKKRWEWVSLFQPL